MFLYIVHRKLIEYLANKFSTFLIMVFNFLKKKDIWKKVGGVEGYVAAVKQLGSAYHELDGDDNGYTKSDSIWGRLTALTQISKKNTYETRKWLFTTWDENRRNIRTIFLSTQVDDLLPDNLNELSNNNGTENILRAEMVSLCCSQLSSLMIKVVINIE